jgi:hypothetical protein
VRRVRQSGQMQNAQVMKTGGELTRDHRRATIGHERTGKAHFLQCLAQAVDQLFGAFVRVPLRMAQEPGPVVDEADQERLDVLPAASQDLARAVMEVKMDELQNMLDFVAAHFALFEPIAGGQGALARSTLRALTQQSVRFQISAHARIRRTFHAGGGEGHPQIVVVQLGG